MTDARPKRERPARGDLMLLARELGYASAKDAYQVLSNNGYEGKFDPDKYDEYVAVLTTHAKTLASILHKLEKEQATRQGDVDRDLPAQAVSVLQALGRRPWLYPPVARDERGNYRKMENREDLRKGEVIAYEGVTKVEFLETQDEARRKEHAVGSGKLSAKDGGDSGVDDDSL